MKKKLILGAAAFVVGFALACVGNAGDSPVQVKGTFATDQACTIDTTIQQGGASYDLAGARQLGTSGATNVDVLVVVQMTSEFSQQEIRQGGRTLADSSRNGAYIDQIQYSYRSTPALTLESETQSMHAYIEPGGDLNAVTDLIGDKAAQKLLDSVSSTSGNTEVIVTLRFRGYTAGSTGATFVTNDIEFPVRFFDSGRVCAGNAVAFTGACGTVSGQGGAITCLATDGGTP